MIEKLILVVSDFVILPPRVGPPCQNFTFFLWKHHDFPPKRDILWLGFSFAGRCITAKSDLKNYAISRETRPGGIRLRDFAATSRCPLSKFHLFPLKKSLFSPQEWSPLTWVQLRRKMYYSKIRPKRLCHFARNSSWWSPTSIFCRHESVPLEIFHITAPAFWSASVFFNRTPHPQPYALFFCNFIFMAHFILKSFPPRIFNS